MCSYNLIICIFNEHLSHIRQSALPETAAKTSNTRSLISRCLYWVDRVSYTGNINNQIRQKNSKKTYKAIRRGKICSLRMVREKILQVYWRRILKDWYIAKSLRLWEGHFNRAKAELQYDGQSANPSQQLRLAKGQIRTKV